MNYIRVLSIKVGHNLTRMSVSKLSPVVVNIGIRKENIFSVLLQ